MGQSVSRYFAAGILIDERGGKHNIETFISLLLH
jgi:hypothetical protein